MSSRVSGDPKRRPGHLLHCKPWLTLYVCSHRRSCSPRLFQRERSCTIALDVFPTIRSLGSHLGVAFWQRTAAVDSCTPCALVLISGLVHFRTALRLSTMRTWRGSSKSCRLEVVRWLWKRAPEVGHLRTTWHAQLLPLDASLHLTFTRNALPSFSKPSIVDLP